MANIYDDPTDIPSVVNRFGFTTLVNDLGKNQDFCVITDGTKLAPGNIGGTIQINDEIIYFSARSGDAPATLTGLEREQEGTEAPNTHDAGSTVTSQIVAGNFNTLKQAVLELRDNKYDLPAGGTADQFIDGTGSLQDIPAYQDADTLIIEVVNDDTVALPKGTVVYISGASGSKPLVKRAGAASETESAKTIGLMRNDTGIGAQGVVVLQGSIDAIDMRNYPAGSELWLSVTPGAFTLNKPQSPNHLVQVGFSIRPDQNGVLEVRIDNGYEIDELHDVLIDNPTANQVLKWNGSNLWTNETLQISDTSGLQTALDGKVDENAPITGATRTKITYDSKGLVTAGANATTTDIAEGTRLYFTNQRAKDAVISQTITNGVTTFSPSEDAVFDALALKANAADVYTKTQLDNGQLDNRYYTETEVDTLISNSEEVFSFANLAGFPATGATDVIYIAEDTDLLYRWDGAAYQQVGGKDPVWGTITGTLSNQTDLQTALNNKYDASNPAGYETPLELDARDTANRDRANHTGTQTAATISDFDTEVANNSAVVANTAKVSADGSIDTHSDVDTTTSSPTTGQALVWDGTTWVPDDVVVDPAGANTEIQFNNSGVFGASANLTYDGALNVKGAGSTSATQALNLTNSSAVSLLTMNDDGTFNGKNIAIGEYANSIRMGEFAADNATGSAWTAIGSAAANSSTTGTEWTAIGRSAGRNNTTGSFWTAIGSNSGLTNVTGSSWTAIGYEAGQVNSSSNFWTAIGRSAAVSNDTGNSWTALGSYSGQNNTTGSEWTAVGMAAGAANLTGSGWTALGRNAGRYIKGSTTPLEYFQNSTYIGKNTKGTNGTSSVLTDNETVIGYAAEGNGSNTVTIGSSAVTDNYFNGDIHAGTSSANGIILTSPNGTKYRLTVENDGSLTTTSI
jgi:hypothetical protein